jgi:3-hydroxyisobutyrate dehydrogenase
VVFTMVGNPGDVREVVLDPAAGVLAGLRPGGVLVDCTSSSPALAREIAAAARVAGCCAVDAPVSGGDVGARDGTLAIFAGGDDATAVARLAPVLAHLGTATHMGAPGSGQSSKIANQVAVAGAAVGLGEAVAFAAAAGLDAPRFLDAISKGAAGSRVMDIFGDRVLRREFMSGGPVTYIIKDLGMALDVGDGQAEGVNVLPGAALFRQMFSAMAANGDGDMCLQGLITVVERLNGIRK